MGATKIINVLKDDSFEEIFELFQGATADDIIFVLPKKSKLFSHASHFAILAREAEKLGKTVSVLCSDPKTNALAEQHGFALMGGAKKNATQATLAAQQHRTPPSDPIAHGDYEDAYGAEDREVGTSDETMNIRHGELEEEAKLEHEGMHVIEGEELKEELGGEGEEHYHEAEEEPGKEELEEIEEGKEEDAEFIVASDQPGKRVYRIVAAAKKMDGMVPAGDGPKKKVKVLRPAERPVSLGVHRGAAAPGPVIEPEEPEVQPEPPRTREAERALNELKGDTMSQVLRSITQPQQNISTKPVYVPGENLPPEPSDFSGADEMTEEPLPREGLEKERSDTLESVWKDEPMDEKGLWDQGLKKKKESIQWGKLFSFGFLRGAKKPAKPLLPGQMLPGQTPAARQSRLSKKLVAGILIASLVVLGTIVYVTTGKAEITLRPIEKKLDTVIKVEASDTFADVDPVFNKIPGQVFSIDKEVSMEFMSSGEKEVAQKARGKMTVYNSYGTGAQTLIATTRFQSKDGLIFRTLNTISVPGPTVENGKVVPGKTDVEVVADKPGPDYNIAAGRFGIIAFKEKGDTDRYEKIYGESSAAMSGGASGLSKVVTESDFSKAKDAVTEKLNAEIQDALKSQAGDLEIVSQPAVKDIEYASTAQPDQAGEKFTVTAKTSLKTVGFKKEHMDELIVKFVGKSDNLTALPEKLDITYADAVFSEEKSLLSLNVILSGPVYAAIDKDQIIADLMGKTEDELREYLKSAPGVSSAKIILSPFWVTRMPKNTDRIKVQIAY